jgi:hypothetical protein
VRLRKRGDLKGVARGDLMRFPGMFPRDSGEGKRLAAELDSDLVSLNRTDRQAGCVGDLLA